MARSLVLTAFVLVLAGCGEGVLEDGSADEASSQSLVPAEGAAQTLDVASWNLEWFGGPAKFTAMDEAHKRANVREVVLGADCDLWGLVEISGARQFSDLVQALPGYAAILATDPVVEGGAAAYSSSDEQKPALVYKTSAFTPRAAKVVLSADSWSFAGRPPLEVAGTAHVNGADVDLAVIVVHLKAGFSVDDRARREASSAKLLSHLAQEHADGHVLVVGDWNDDLDVSLARGLATPFADLLADARFVFPTKALTDAHRPTTLFHQEAIDHHLADAALAQWLVPGSAKALRADALVASYRETTSDHFPVLSRYAVPAAAARVLVNEVLANEPGAECSKEFVELLNAGRGTADLSGWTLSDAGGARHVFAPGASLAPGRVLVVYGSTASAGTLSLNNGGDSVVVRDAEGRTRDRIDYSAGLSAIDGRSFSRSVAGDPASALVLTSPSPGAP